MADQDTPAQPAKSNLSAIKHRHMERSLSEDIREEREDLKEAAEYTQSVVVELSLDGSIRWVSPSWREVVGTDPTQVLSKPISSLVVSNSTVFESAIQSIRKDDARSHNIRFSILAGPDSTLHKKSCRKDPVSPESLAQDVTLDLEGQGIMIYDRSTGVESHTMWMLKPYVIREITIDLPDVLVESLGVGAEILARFLTRLAEEGVTDHKDYPRPPPVLCRICERQITAWWFEKHTELCLQEHTAERDVQFAQENLQDLRKAIVKVLDALEAQPSRQPRSSSLEAPSPTQNAEYKGFIVGASNSTPPTLGSPSPTASRSRERPSSGFGHHRARSFAVRRPVPRIVELLLDLCDTAIEINMPAVKDIPGQTDGEVRTQSPESENRISQVLQWQSPSTGTVEQDQGLSLLCEDTSKSARAKIDAVHRYRAILEYSERITVEFDLLVQECIEAAVQKAAKIAAGELSDSSEDHFDDEIPVETLLQSPEILPNEDSIFPCSLDTPSAITDAIRHSHRRSIAVYSDLPTSTATSTRSNSPRGSRTPKSHIGAPSVASLSKRASMLLESDAGADSDGSVPSISRTMNRAESPISEMSLSRMSTTRENKRRSLILPSAKASRQDSPARSMPPPPSSPLRMAKTRIASGTERSQSPITSPILLAHEFSSPALPSHLQHGQYYHNHRRQSSVTSSDMLRPTSPRLQPVSSSNPQPRAAPPSIKDFEIIKPISKGAFGSVFLAKKKSTNEYFAIKALKKADMVAKNQVTNVKAERAIMMWQGESEFVAKLYWTFANKEFLFLVMEYMNGGDCASLVKSLMGLPEEWGKRYLAEVVLGVEHLHSRGIVHRDLKPDNLLIDSHGHLKLTDFGLSRMGIVGRQKRAIAANPEELAVPDLLKQGPFQRIPSVTSSRSASFDFQGSQSPSQTPSLTPMIDFSQPSYFNLHREPSRRASAARSDSENSDALNSMFRRFSLVDDALLPTNHSPVEEETESQTSESQDAFALQSTMSPASAIITTDTPPPINVGPNLALFDPQDSTRKFVGTPDYLAPETINGVGQDELSDWWSLGCILFEFLYGYPPFNADTPDEVFQNILARNIHWPPIEDDEVSSDAKDLMNRLMCVDLSTRLGSNTEGKFATGAEEIKAHPWFSGIQWETVRDTEASFVPAPENPEDTEYFDTRGATLQTFTQFEDQETSPLPTPSSESQDRPHDALSKVRSQVNSVKRGLIPLHIPPHVRDGRSRRLSEPVPTDDFGNFNFKNLPVLEKANKDVIQKLKAEAMQAQNKSPINTTNVSISPATSLDSSPIVPMPLKRALSTSKSNRPSSPLLFPNQSSASPSRASQPSSPLLVQFSTGHHHERRKTSSSSSSLSVQTSNSLQPGGGAFLDGPRIPPLKPSSGATSPVKFTKSPGQIVTSDRGMALHRQVASGSTLSPRGRSHTISSQESEDVVKELKPEHKRRSVIMDISPSSSDNEDTRQKALLRVQRRRQSSHRLSQITLSEGPIFRPLDVLVCEDHPVSRLVMEKLLERLRCRTVTASSGTEASRYAMSEVKFDIIFTEARLPQLSGSDFARMVRRTKNVNSTTPIVAVTGYLKELPPNHFFDGLIEKPPTIQKITEIMGRLCQWKAPPPISYVSPSAAPTMPWPIPAPALAHLRYGSILSHEDSPTSFSSGFPTMPSGSYRGSSREDSIGSSFFGDNDSRAGQTHNEDNIAVKHLSSDSGDWQDKDLIRNFEGLGISGTEEPDLTVESKTSSQRNSPSPVISPGDTTPLKNYVKPLALPPPAVHSRLSPPGDINPLRKKRSDQKLQQQQQQQQQQKQIRKSRLSGESGDDEDDELGMRVKSPKNRPRGTSKLGHEMLRTNSRGSVISVEGIETQLIVSQLDPISSPVPPASPETGRDMNTSISTPPAQASTQQDSKGLKLPLGPDPEATPKAPHSMEMIDQDPTPKANLKVDENKDQAHSTNQN